MSYQLDTLESMNNYYDWIMDEFNPHIGTRVIEIGAGIGTISQRLLANKHIEHLWIIEPDDTYASILTDKFSGISNITIIISTVENISCEFVTSLNIDTVIMVNLLEHIYDDSALLDKLYHALPYNSKVLTFSPAFPLLYSKYDKLVGHYRRYTKKSINCIFKAAHFNTISVKYFNFLGFFTWLLFMKFLNHNTFGEKKLKIYNIIINILKFIEHKIPVPIGQSVIATYIKC